MKQNQSQFHHQNYEKSQIPKGKNEFLKFSLILWDGHKKWKMGQIFVAFSEYPNFKHHIRTQSRVFRANSKKMQKKKHTKKPAKV